MWLVATVLQIDQLTEDRSMTILTNFIYIILTPIVVAIMGCFINGSKWNWHSIFNTDIFTRFLSYRSSSVNCTYCEDTDERCKYIPYIRPFQMSLSKRSLSYANIRPIFTSIYLNHNIFFTKLSEFLLWKHFNYCNKVHICKQQICYLSMASWTNMVFSY